MVRCWRAYTLYYTYRQMTKSLTPLYTLIEKRKIIIIEIIWIIILLINIPLDIKSKVIRLEVYTLQSQSLQHLDHDITGTWLVESVSKCQKTLGTASLKRSQKVSKVLNTFRDTRHCKSASSSQLPADVHRRLSSGKLLSLATTIFDC